MSYNNVDNFLSLIRFLSMLHFAYSMLCHELRNRERERERESERERDRQSGQIREKEQKHARQLPCENTGKIIQFY